MQIELPILNINKLKVDYFFSNSLHIDSFLNKLQFEFRLTTTEMHKTIARGINYTLNNFTVSNVQRNYAETSIRQVAL